MSGVCITQTQQIQDQAERKHGLHAALTPQQIVMKKQKNGKKLFPPFCPLCIPGTVLLDSPQFLWAGQ